MAKKKRSTPMPMPEYRPPSPAKMRDMAAEGAARTAVESDPALKRKVTRVKNAILGAINKSLGRAGT